MGAKFPGSYVGLARPIMAERDYRAVKRLVADRCQGIYLLLEAERLEALIRELTLYEEDPEGCASSASPAAQSDAPALQRRWSDSGPVQGMS